MSPSRVFKARIAGLVGSACVFARRLNPGVVRLLLASGVLGLLLTSSAQGSPLTFLDDYEGFVEAAPTEVQSIDFETLPDGSPSYAGAEITPEFNYTHLGATFLPHRDPGTYIYGNSVTGFHLNADSYPSFERNWIIADLAEPAWAVGTWFVSDCIFSVFDGNGDLLLEVSHGGAGAPMRFVGIVSDVPIARATMDQSFYAAWSDEFVFASVPEPSSGAGLLILGAIGLVRCRRRAGCRPAIRRPAIRFAFTSMVAGVIVLLAASGAYASPLTFIDDYEGFVEAAPTEVRSIDFETLPDGSPSYPGAVITPEFNYTHLGATFLPHQDPGLYIYGNPSGFNLNADSYPVGGRNWIIAELVTPGSAIGTYHVSSATLSAFDLNGDVIAVVTNGGAGVHFTGIVSDVPVAYATIDKGTSYAASNEFVFADIPDPSSGALVLIAGVMGLRRHRAWRTSP